MSGLDPQGISGTAWASAQLRLADAAYFDAMSNTVVARTLELGQPFARNETRHI